MKARKTKINMPLKLAIVASQLRAYDVAARARMREDRLSQITQGHRPARPEEQVTLARILGRDVRELFPESVAS